jgi:phytol kinase
VAAFLCVHVPLLLWTDTGRAESLLIALNVALVAMMAEAIAWHGLDNFFVPFFGFVLLRAYLPMGPLELGVHCLVLVGLFVFVYLWRRRTNMAANARLGGVLFGYMVWLLAGWPWLVPPILLFATYRALSRKVTLDVTRHIDFPVVSSVLVPPLAWVVRYWFSPSPLLIHAYATIFAAHMAMIALVRDMHVMPGTRWLARVPANVARGALLLILPTLLATGLVPGAAVCLLVGIISVTLALIAFCLLQPALETYPLDTARWLRQAACVTGASLLTFALLQLEVVGRLVPGR